MVHAGAVASASESHRLAFDPDALPEWEDVVQVGMLQHGQSIKCPICLSEPTVPQTTLCAHVFCFKCILKHLMLRDGGVTAQPCPLCYALVRTSELRPVSLRAVPVHQPGEMVRLKLIARRKSSVVPLEIPPAGGLSWHECDAAHGWPHASVNGWNPISKLSVADSLEEFVRSEVESLEEQAQDLRSERTDESHGELSWVLHALELARQRGYNWAEREAACLGQPPPDPSNFAPGNMGSPASDIGVHDPPPEFGSAAAQAIAHATSPASYELSESEWPSLTSHTTSSADRADSNGRNVGARAQNAASVGEGERKNDECDHDALHLADDEPVFGPIEDDKQVHDTSTKAYPSSIRRQRYSNTASLGSPAVTDDNGAADERCFFYYWHSKGSAITLAPVNIKCLLAEYSYYSRFPSSIRAEIVELEEEQMTEEKRKRWKHLGHLPLTTPVKVVELDLSPLLSQEALQSHAHELQQRQRNRQRRREWEKQQEENRRIEREREVRPGGPSAAELRSMPSVTAAYSPPVSDPESEAGSYQQRTPTPMEMQHGYAEHSMLQQQHIEGLSPTASGVSFARVAHLGYASEAHSPALASSSAQGPTQPTAAWPVPQGVWAGSSVAQVAASTNEQQQQQARSQSPSGTHGLPRKHGKSGQSKSHSVTITLSR